MLNWMRSFSLKRRCNDGPRRTEGSDRVRWIGFHASIDSSQPMIGIRGIRGVNQVRNFISQFIRLPYCTISAQSGTQVGRQIDT